MKESFEFKEQNNKEGFFSVDGKKICCEKEKL